MRITHKSLTTLANQINRKFIRPETAWTEKPGGNGGLVANISHIYVENAFRCYNLCEMNNADGGVVTLVDGLSAREMQCFLKGMLAAIKLGEDNQNR